MELRYQLKFFSQWRSDAGASFGAATDNAVVRDAYGLPYFPGKTLKGLFRESVEDYINFMEVKRSDEVEVIFGGEAKEGICHFTDATFSEKEANAILYTNCRNTFITILQRLLLMREELPRKIH